METVSSLYSKISNILYNNNYITLQLYNRYRNNNEMHFNMQIKDLQKVFTLDEFIYKVINENLYNQYRNPVNQYITIISKQLETEPLLLLSLPIWKLEKNELKKYLYNYDNIINKINYLQSEANTIYRKFEISPSQITQHELLKMIKFFSYTIPYANEKMIHAQEIVAKYLLNNQENRDKDFNYEAATFLLKLFGYKKLKEEKLEDTKIIIGSLPQKTYGKSSDNYAIVNKTLLKSILLENNTLENNFGYKKVATTHNFGYLNSRINNGFQLIEASYEILGIMQTLYHEIRHQKQKKHSNEHKLDDISYYYASFEIINENNESDYKKNYKSYEIEKDANYKAWEDIEILIKTYMPNKNNERLMKNILNHKLKEELEQITGIRKTTDNKSYISNDLLIKYLDNKFINNTNLITRKYRQFLNFYNHNGTPKKVIELLTKPLIYNYKDFYFGQVSYRSRMIGYGLTANEIKSLQPKEIQTVIDNLKILMSLNKEKINKICDRVKKYNEPIEEINGNIINYYKFANYLSNTMNSILKIHPNIINILSIRNSIKSINTNIDMINNNSLVIRILSDSSKISRVGRR